VAARERLARSENSIVQGTPLRGPLQMAAFGPVWAALHGWPVTLAAQLCALDLGAPTEVSGGCQGAQSGFLKQGQWEAGHCLVPLWTIREGSGVEGLPGQSYM
jgi:hypothetical protein